MVTLSAQGGFELIYEKISGQPASQFQFTPGVTPMGTYREVMMTITTYIVVVFGGQYLMRNFKPFKLSTVSAIHNGFLTVLSLALFIAFLENTIPLIADVGFYSTICKKEYLTTQLELIGYINYLTKYYELLDTVLMVLKKKPLTFLHSYHHSATAMLCFVNLAARFPITWVPITLNLGVHVFMYYYYLLTTLGQKVWWKKHITTLQIVQFVIDLSVIAFCFYSHHAFHYFPSLPNMGACYGDLSKAMFGIGVLFSYLLLFIQFFYNSYKSKVAAASSSAATSSAKKLTEKQL